MPESSITEETVISFEPEAGGGAEIRFEGIIYALARLFTFPLEDSRLREIRVFTHKPKEGRQVTHLTLLMEAKKDNADPRRMIVFQDVRERELQRNVFSVQSIRKKKELSFSYAMPDRRYTYQLK